MSFNREFIDKKCERCKCMYTARVLECMNEWSKPFWVNRKCWCVGYSDVEVEAILNPDYESQ